jgi:6,7-dimethyl-8-ribityllumazine synthase
MSLNASKEPIPSAPKLKVAIVAARYNLKLVDSLLEHTLAPLRQAGIHEPVVERVPGSAELPFAAELLASAMHPDVIIALGVVVAGDTDHHTLIGNATAQALCQVSLHHRIPVINGIIITNNREQAEARTIGPINRGSEFAHAAVEMGLLKNQWTQ